jgi:hypothetical protein
MIWKGIGRRSSRLERGAQGRTQFTGKFGPRLGAQEAADADSLSLPGQFDE